MEWRATSLDQMIPNDHRVRAVWAYVDAQHGPEGRATAASSGRHRGWLISWALSPHA
jgi:hypothetical protein